MPQPNWPLSLEPKLQPEHTPAELALIRHFPPGATAADDPQYDNSKSRKQDLARSRRKGASKGGGSNKI